MKIKSIEIQNFRGIPDYKFDLDGKNLLLYGENGTGKSSLVEAIEYFFTNEISSLKGSRGISVLNHAFHVKSSIDKLKINMLINPGSKEFTKLYNEKISPSNGFQEAFEQAKNSTFILRRNQLLYFIACTPKEKFDALASIIKLDYLEIIEREFDDALNFLEIEYTSKNELLKNFLKKISNILERQVISVENAFDILSIQLNEHNRMIGPISTLNDVENLIEKFQSQSKLNIRIMRKNSDILSNLENIRFPEVLETDIRNLHKMLLNLLTDNSYSDLAFQKMLKASITTIQYLDTNFCPLCEQEYDRETLLEKTKARLDMLKSLTKELRKVNSIIRTISLHLQTLKKEIDSFINLFAFKELNASVQSKLFQAQKDLETYLEKDLLQDLNFSLSLLNEILELKPNLVEVNQLISKSIGIPKKDFEIPVDKETEFVVVRKLINFKNDMEDIMSIIEFQQIKQKEVAIAKTINEKFKASKNSVLQEIFDSIQSSIEKYYHILHADDPHNNIKLEVSQDMKNRVLLRIDSFGREKEDPRGFLSEGHIDSLGICVFLAFIKHFNKSFKILVLDDIVTTIDSHHRSKICQLLFEEFSDFQIIITTHDKIWYEQIRSSQKMYLIEGKFLNLTINDWDINSGPYISPYKPVWQKIENFLKVGLISSAANEGRRYLEWLLKEICENTETKVFLKRNKQYTVSDLFLPAKSRFKKLISDDKINSVFEQKFNRISSTVIYANFLSHDNPFAENLSKVEVRDFCNSVKDLHDSVLCDSCKNFLVYIREIRYLRCCNPRCQSPMELKTK